MEPHILLAVLLPFFGTGAGAAFVFFLRKNLSLRIHHSLAHSAVFFHKPTGRIEAYTVLGCDIYYGNEPVFMGAFHEVIYF